MIVVEDYTFTPGGRGAGTIVIPRVIELEDIQRIWNVTRGALIYEATNSEYGITGIVVANGATTLTIETNTSTMNAADELQILLYAESQGGNQGSGSVTTDAFGRARVSEPYTIGDYKHLYAIDPNFLDSIGNGGSVTFNPNQASATLATSSNPASYAVHQTKLYHQYQPGKSQLIFSSIVFGAAVTNVTKRTGYFDDRNGIYFEQVGDGTLNWVIRNYVTGAPVETGYRIPQAQWNVDPCDGTGPSGFDLDVTKTQLIFIDFQWLGVGRVRCGFVHNGNMVVAHEYFHSNNISTVYLSSPNLPVRCEIRNTGATTGGSFDQICSSVQSEGGYQEAGIDWTVANGVMRLTPTPGGTALPVLALRLKNSFGGTQNRMNAILTNIGLYVETKPIRFEVVKLPNASSLSTTDVGGLVWTDVDADSGCQYCVNATSYTAANGDPLFGGFSSAGTSQNSRSEVGTGGLTASKKNFIVQNFDSTSSEVYAVIVRTIPTGNQDQASVACSLQWREVY
jgi:hypothetical protein